jgi:hypothetical protein
VPDFELVLRRPIPLAARQVDTAGSAAALRRRRGDRTGGWSLLGQTLLSWAEGSGPGPCEVALGAPAASAAASPAKDEPANLVNEVGKAVGKLFGK